MWKFPDGILPKQTSKKLASEPPQTSKKSLQKRFHGEAGPGTVLSLGAHQRPILSAPQLKSGKKKQHKHKFFGPDFPRTFLTLTPGCPGVKKFLPTTGAAGKRTFWRGRPRFSARTSMTRRVLEKLCTKKVCVDFLVPTKGPS